MSLVGVDLIEVAQRQADVIPAVDQPLPGEVVEREGGLDPGGGRIDGAALRRRR